MSDNTPNSDSDADLANDQLGEEALMRREMRDRHGGASDASTSDSETESPAEESNEREADLTETDRQASRDKSMTDDSTTEQTDVAQTAAAAAKADTDSGSGSSESGIASKLRNGNISLKWPATIIVLGSISPFWYIALKQSLGMPAHHFSPTVLAGIMLLAASGMAFAYMFFLGASSDESVEAMERAAAIAQQLTEARQSEDATHTKDK